MIDTWSQMVIKHTEDSVDIITEAPETGIYRMLEDGRVVFDRFDYHRRAVESENEAFFLRILQARRLPLRRRRPRHPGDPRPLDDQEFQLNERAEEWIHGIKQQFAASRCPWPRPARPLPIPRSRSCNGRPPSTHLWRADQSEDAARPEMGRAFRRILARLSALVAARGRRRAADLPGKPAAR